jgi:hypothetical protein
MRDGAALETNRLQEPGGCVGGPAASKGSKEYYPQIAASFNASFLGLA